MGLGSQLKKSNVVNDALVNSAQQPVADAGYNNANIPALPPARPMDQKCHDEVNKVITDTKRETDRISNPTTLQKPNIPYSADQSTLEINTCIVEKMWRIICLKNLYAFYTQERLQMLVDRACKHNYLILMKQFNIPTISMVTDLAVLGLYDIVLNIDDSGSMATREPSEDNMYRYETMREVIKTISFFGSLMDIDGICIRFFNNPMVANCISSSAQVDEIMNHIRYTGGTPMGESIRNKIFGPDRKNVGDENTYLNELMYNGLLERPVLIMTITDGRPNSEQAVIDAIVHCKQQSERTKYGTNCFAFSFSQIGSDMSATEYLNNLDTHHIVGNIIDCTSSFEIEKRQCGQNFNETSWIIKSMIGAIDPSYDQMDEQHTRPQLPIQQQQYQYPTQHNQMGYNTPQQFHTVQTPFGQAVMGIPMP